MTISLELQEYLEALDIFTMWLRRFSKQIDDLGALKMYFVPLKTKQRIDKECKLAFRILASANLISYRPDRQAVLVPTREGATEMLLTGKPLIF